MQQALRHRSVGGTNNERLEFLGDAVLGMVIAHELYTRFPKAAEGELSRLRASLVKKPTLAEVARDLKLGDFLVLGSGELKSGGFRRDSILADALEAVFGAIYLDAGFASCRDVILRLYRNRLDATPAAAQLKDPKTRLQEYLQAQHLDLPEYTVTAIQGQAHRQTFEVSCRVAQLDQQANGTGSSRRRAEQDAAACMLALLDPEPT